MTDDGPKPPISPEELHRRREAVRQADANNRIEGIPHDPTFDPLFEAWIVGEIEIEEVLARIKAMLGIR